MGYNTQERKNIITGHMDGYGIYQSHMAKEIAVSQTKECLYKMFDIKKEKIEEIAIHQEDEIWKCFMDTSELLEAVEDFKRNSIYAREVCTMILKLGEYVFKRKIPKAYKKGAREPNIAVKETTRIIDQHKKVSIDDPKNIQQEKQQKFVDIINQLAKKENISPAIVTYIIQIMKEKGEGKAREFLNNFIKKEEKKETKIDKNFTNLFPCTIELFYHEKKENFSLGNFLQITQKLEPFGSEVLENIQKELENALLEIDDNFVEERQIIEKILKNIKNEIKRKAEIKRKDEKAISEKAKIIIKHTKGDTTQNEQIKNDTDEVDRKEDISEDKEGVTQDTKKEQEIQKAANEKTQQVILAITELLSIMQELLEKVKKQLEEIKGDSNKQKKIITIVNDFIEKFQEEKEKRTTPTTKNTLECLTKIRQNDILSIPQMDEKKLHICIHNNRFTNSIEDIIQILKLKIEKKEEIMQSFLMIEKEAHRPPKRRAKAIDEENDDITEEMHDTEAYISEVPTTIYPKTIDDVIEEDIEENDAEEDGDGYKDYKL